MRNINLAIIIFLLLTSCTEIDLQQNLSDQVSFEISDWILDDTETNCLDFDSKGNVWIGAGSELIFYNGNKISRYDLDSLILDISVAPDGKIWLGTRDKGLACFNGKRFDYYTMENASLPRDYIPQVEAAPDGKIWFSSAAHDLGGLMVFDGSKFELFTPENSPMNQHVIHSLTVDRNGNVYLVTLGKVGRSVVYRISDNKWECLGDEEDGFYWVMAMAVSLPGNIYVVEDFSLSSCSYDPASNLYVYRENKWTKMETDFTLRVFFGQINVDLRDYLWVVGYSNDTGLLHVYTGDEWVHSEKDRFPDVYIRSIQVDHQNNIWLCTNKGILILNQ